MIGGFGLTATNNWTGSGNPNGGTNGGGGTGTGNTATPEPASLILFGTGFFAALLLKRRLREISQV